MFLRKKKALYDYQPKELNSELLNVLYAGLIAKLTLTSEELMARHTNLASLSETLVSTDITNNLSGDTKKKHLADAAKFRARAQQMRNLHNALVNELAYIKSKMD